MPGRTWRGGDKYRYGYQNQEEDMEFWGGAVSYEYRIEDPRIGRFFSVDPLAYDYPWNSPYAFSENRVTNAVELEGLEASDLNTSTTVSGGGPTDVPTAPLAVDQMNPKVITSIPTNGTTPEPIINSPVNNTPDTNPSSKNALSSNSNLLWYQVYAKSWVNLWNGFVSWDARKTYEMDHRQDDHTSRPPVNTNNGGYIIMGGGATKNQWAFGNPERSEDGFVPGWLIASKGKMSAGGIPESEIKTALENFANVVDGLTHMKDNMEKINGGGENKPALSNDSVDVEMIIGGKVVVRKPKNPQDNKDVKGIIKQGPGKGKTVNVFNNK